MSCIRLANILLKYCRPIHYRLHDKYSVYIQYIHTTATTYHINNCNVISVHNQLSFLSPSYSIGIIYIILINLSTTIYNIFQLLLMFLKWRTFLEKNNPPAKQDRWIITFIFLSYLCVNIIVLTFGRFAKVPQPIKSPQLYIQRVDSIDMNLHLLLYCYSKYLNQHPAS